MKRRLITAGYWFVLGLNALVWLSGLSRGEGDIIAHALLMLAPFAVLPVIRWIRTGGWHIDPR